MKRTLGQRVNVPLVQRLTTARGVVRKRDGRQWTPVFIRRDLGTDRPHFPFTLWVTVVETLAAWFEVPR
jgi:hypothetical protein